ncbi:MAG TPA: YbhB/YbcL family Raf kinase inhibitor-like protein [Acidimicrobiia bacterium]|nr:YbhB/YbcL family Raf kinase inhibitor-like protein [Acidimicrobiia bacterium]
MAHKPGLRLVAGFIVLSACGTPTLTTSEPLTSSTTTPGGTMQITSPAFVNNSPIPDIYTCRGDDINPPVDITGVPAEAMSLVLLVVDPDAPDPAAPKVVWDHWVMWNIAPGTSTIEPGTVPAGAVQGTNSWGRTDYGGPCPPIGTHRYFFKLYALDTTLALGTTSFKADVEMAMQGHVLDQAELIGLYGE